MQPRWSRRGGGRKISTLIDISMEFIEPYGDVRREPRVLNVCMPCGAEQALLYMQGCVVDTGNLCGSLCLSLVLLSSQYGPDL